MARLLCEVAALPFGVARPAEQNWLQAELRPNDGAKHKAAIGRATAHDEPAISALKCMSRYLGT